MKKFENYNCSHTSENLSQNENQCEVTVIGHCLLNPLARIKGAKPTLPLALKDANIIHPVSRSHVNDAEEKISLPRAYPKTNLFFVNRFFQNSFPFRYLFYLKSITRKHLLIFIFSIIINRRVYQYNSIKYEGDSMTSGVFRKIMVATDGSEASERAVDTAVEIAKMIGTKLYALHVIPVGFYSMGLPTGEEWEKAFAEQLATEGREATAYVENTGRTANVEVESVVLRGSPAEGIIEFAEKNDIGLIVMGTHGMTGIKGILNASIADNVVRNFEKSVLVVR
jgi:nucleotide-binding universal stress UspA family protein